MCNHSLLTTLLSDRHLPKKLSQATTDNNDSKPECSLALTINFEEILIICCKTARLVNAPQEFYGKMSAVKLIPVNLRYMKAYGIGLFSELKNGNKMKEFIEKIPGYCTTTRTNQYSDRIPQIKENKTIHAEKYSVLYFVCIMTAQHLINR